MRAALLLLLAGCFHPSPPDNIACNTSRECPSGLSCSLDNRCVLPGELTDAGGVDGAPDAMIDACPTAACAGADLVDCTGTVTCSNGCVATNGPHCAALVPSNGISVGLLNGSTGELTNPKYDIDASSGRIKSGPNTVRQPGTGVISGIGFAMVNGYAVFTAQRMDLGANGNWNVTGPTPVVFFSATTITITGALDAGGQTAQGGPGGQTSGSDLCDGAAGMEYSTGFADGGGGGGGATAGADGGATMSTITGTGGHACAGAPTTIPLHGGEAGGAGGVDGTGTLFGGRGGGGGGAIALVAMESITINSAGAVGSPGGGGESTATGDGGGGGGGGGAVLLESPIVMISGSLTANGGGGGAPYGGASGNRGSVHTANAATGGVYMTGAGGAGGVGGVAPVAGTVFSDLTPSARGGGGGGAVGRMEIKSRSSSTTGATLSPAPVASMAVVQ